MANDWKTRATPVTEENDWKSRAQMIEEPESSTVGQIVGTLGSILDYPVAPVREAIGSSAEMLLGKKTPGEVLGRTIEPLVAGPSQSRDWKQIMEDIGVPETSNIPAAGPMGIEKLMTEEELAQTPKFSPSAVMGGYADIFTPMASEKMLAATVGKAPTALKKAAANFSMIPEKVLETTWSRPQELAKIPMDVEAPIAQAVQAWRERTNDLKKQFMSVRNAKISQALQEKGSHLVDIEPIEKIYEEALQKSPKKYGAEARGRIEEQLNILRNAANENGQLEAAEIFQMTKDLDQMANYMPASQELKQAKDFADVTFMRAAGRARQITGRVMPEARQAMQEIAPLRRVGQNKPILNILDVNKPYAPIMGVGTGQNQQNIMNLRKLGNILGEDLVGQAENIAAAQYMGNAGLVPNVQTGARNAVLQALSGTAGYAAGGLTGAAIPTLAIGALSSPLVIKTAITQTRKGVDFMNRIVPPGGKNMLEGLIQAGMKEGVSPIMMDTMVKTMDGLTNTERAQFRKQLGKGQ